MLLPLVASAETITTNNLIVNGDFNDGTNGWTLSGDAVRINDCCPGGYDLEFGASGSIEQTFNLTSESITQSMLDLGTVLRSSVEIQNGECGVQGCWGGSGPADKTIVRLQILDENSNVLAVTTQERFNVTGINGENYSDSVSYTGTGSNMGNIYIFGSDSSGGSASLLGPNVDNISVTMEYSPIVLSTAQTSQISTAVEEVEEVKIEEYKFEEVKVEEIKLEELKIEEFEQPGFSSVSLKVEEEILTGIVNVFEEVKHEESKTIETLTTEVESFEEENINNETTAEGIKEIEEEFIAAAGGESGIESNESSYPGGGSSENQIIGGEPGEEPTQEITETNDEERLGETESEVASNEERNGGTQEEPQVEAREENMDNDPQDERSVSISISDVQEKVAEKIKEVDKQIVATQVIVARIMTGNNKMIDSYSTVNQDIFNNQLEIDGGTLDDFYTRDYSDDRDLYAEIQNPYADSMAQYQKKIDDAVANRIIAEENLRRIRGY